MLYSSAHLPTFCKTGRSKTARLSKPARPSGPAVIFSVSGWWVRAHGGLRAAGEASFAGNLGRIWGKCGRSGRRPPAASGLWHFGQFDTLLATGRDKERAEKANLGLSSCCRTADDSTVHCDRNGACCAGPNQPFLPCQTRLVCLPSGTGLWCTGWTMCRLQRRVW